jgi:hypothetical protein
VIFLGTDMPALLVRRSPRGVLVIPQQRTTGTWSYWQSRVNSESATSRRSYRNWKKSTHRKTSRQSARTCHCPLWRMKQTARRLSVPCSGTSGRGPPRRTGRRTASAQT